MSMWEYIAATISEGILFGALFAAGMWSGRRSMRHWRDAAARLSRMLIARDYDLRQLQRRILREADTDPDIDAALDELPTIPKMASVPPPGEQ